MSKQWMVYSKENGMICIIDDYNKALEEYEKEKEAYKDYVVSNNEHDDSEIIVLAEVKKQFYSYETTNPTGEKINPYYWDFKEVTNECNKP